MRLRRAMTLPLLLPLSLNAQERLPVLRPSSDAFSGPAQDSLHSGIRAAWLGSAMFLSDGGYVFVDDSTRQAYRATGTGQVQPLTDAEPDLPSTLRLIGRLSSGEVVVADDHRGRLGTVTADGLKPMGEYPPRWRPACVVGDGTIVVRSSAQARLSIAQESRDGVHRFSVEYFAMDRQGVVQPFATAAGDETTYLTMQGNGWRTHRSTPVIFGHKTLVACSRSHLIIAQSDLGVATFVDHGADTVLTLPLPGRRRAVSKAQIEVQRRISTASAAQRSRIERRRYNYMASTAGIRIAHPDLTADDMSAVPSNDVAPPVDRLFVDASDRIWVRLLPFPEDEMIRWHVWRVNRRATAFLVELPRQTDVADAYDDRVLLSVKEPGKYDRLVVASMIESLNRAGTTRPLQSRSRFTHEPRSNRRP